MAASPRARVHTPRPAAALLQRGEGGGGSVDTREWSGLLRLSLASALPGGGRPTSSQGRLIVPRSAPHPTSASLRVHSVPPRPSTPPHPRPHLAPRPSPLEPRSRRSRRSRRSAHLSLPPHPHAPALDRRPTAMARQVDRKAATDAQAHRADTPSRHTDHRRPQPAGDRRDHLPDLADRHTVLSCTRPRSMSPALLRSLGDRRDRSAFNHVRPSTTFDHQPRSTINHVQHSATFKNNQHTSHQTPRTTVTCVAHVVTASACATCRREDGNPSFQ